MYLGIETGIKHTLSSEEIIGCDHLELSFNIDGVPIYKSRSISVWPIQGVINNVEKVSKKPFIIAMYSGTKKPQTLEFLLDFVEELKILMNAGVEGKDVIVKNIICDAPARAFVKGIKQFNAFYGCDFCDVKGEYDGRMLFLHDGTQRTDSSFRQKINIEHHKEDSPFLQLNIDMVKQFPIDPMHCVDLGVTKRLLVLWREGPLPHRLSAGKISIISQFHQAIRQYIPLDFNRKPRGLDELRMWKATEFRLFLMYTGPIIMKNVLDEKKYEHFLSLSIGICILFNENLSDHRRYGAELLKYFVEQAVTLYSRNFISYNVHCLLHLLDTATYNKTLNDCSAYKFENNMTQLKRCVRGTGEPLIQIANRMAEKHVAAKLISRNEETRVVVPKVKACYTLSCGKFCIVHEVRERQVLCEVYKRTEALYSVPCDSRILGVHKGFLQQTEMMLLSTERLVRSAIMIPLSLVDRDLATARALIPLMHAN